MPLPKPTLQENQKDFIDRCMIDKVMTEEYGFIDQRLAICALIWRKES